MFNLDDKFLILNYEIFLFAIQVFIKKIAVMMLVYNS